MPKNPASYGDPILPASEPRILTVMEGAHGRLQVRPIAELEEHGLFYDPGTPTASGHPRGWTCLAQHANGYSCHALATRILAAWAAPEGIARAAAEEHAVDQHTYILRCGGLGRDADVIAAVAAGRY